MIEQIIDAGKKLVPPADDSDPKKVRRWRMKVFYGLSGVWLVVLAMIVVSFGVWPAVYPGFANAEDQQQVQSDIGDLRVEALTTRIFNLRVSQCQAIKDGKSAAAYTVQLTEQLLLYEKLTGKVYQNLPKCEEL